MKIIFITDTLKSGGAERVLATVANEFIKHNFDVTIILKYNQPSFYFINDKIKIVYPRPKIKGNFFRKILSRSLVYCHIYQILKFNAPDIVISFSTTTNGVSIILCRLLQIPIIACEHSNYRNGLNYIPNWFIKRHIYPFTNILTVLTERDKDEFYDRFMNQAHVLPNPLDENMLFTNSSIRKKNNIILAIGNIDRWNIKGFDNLLKIFSSIANKYTSWNLHIAGDGDPNFLNSLVDNYHLKQRVLFLGEVKNIQQIMLRSSIFVLTSRFEGLPMALIEAMSQGMPCISFDCFTGPGEIITNMVDGILVSDQDNDEFTNKLCLLIEDESLQKRLGLNAINTSKKYNMDYIFPKWQNLIEIALKK